MQNADVERRGSQVDTSPEVTRITQDTSTMSFSDLFKIFLFYFLFVQPNYFILWPDFLTQIITDIENCAT